MARIKSSLFYKAAEQDEDGYELTDIVADLSEAPTANEFDEVWSAFYDWADFDHRIWIDT